MRALLLVLDSVGVGDAPDAAEYGDQGANTLGHIFEHRPDLRLRILEMLGLSAVIGQKARGGFRASFGRMREKSAGKDTTTGHWEIAGVILQEPFATFAAFPRDLVSAIETEANVTFIGNYARSGTTVLEELGAAHLRTGNPILYTSADSVMQIAAHEQVVQLERLYEICKVARRHCDAYRIGRVIARPFVGEPGSFRRTANRHDFSMTPPPTVLNALLESGTPVVGVGKIGDIFAGSGISETHQTASNAEGMRVIDRLWDECRDGLIFANLVDFDMLFGHRRDVTGYAAALEQFDQWLGPFLSRIESDELVIITADHGNDPTFRGTDHTREEVPLFVLHRSESRNLGTRSTYADVAASLAQHFRLAKAWPSGTGFLTIRRDHVTNIHDHYGL